MKTIQKIGSVIYTILFLCLVVIAGVVAVSTLKMPGSYKLLTVQSGSMEPAIRTGSVVLVQPQKEYRKGDVITTSKPANPKVSVTHRIININGKGKDLKYVTKGDANKTVDTELRLPEQIIGKVLFSIPFIGYPVAFAKTRTGLIVLIIIPSTMIVYGEMINIKNEVVNLLKKKKKKKLNPVEEVELAVGQEEIKLEKSTNRWWSNLFGKK